MADGLTFSFDGVGAINKLKLQTKFSLKLVDISVQAI